MSTKVIVLGGGVAGMSAAHELVERGFDVVVLESGDIAGGKARSIPVFHEGEDTSGHQVADGAGSSIQHRVPGEHGFRFFPGFYKHVIDTMRRIPSFDGSKVADHLVPITGSTDRVLDGPTNLVWIDPWLAYLESRGVRYVKNARVEEILYENGRITGVVARQQGQRIMVHGDHYVAALPLEDIAPLVSDRLAAADPTLANLRALAPNLEWMNGVQFYLHRAVPSAHGHVIHIDTEWALTSISQLQFWRDV